MINKTLERTLKKFKTEIDDCFLCTLKTIRYDQADYPDYTQNEIQHLYLLRYFPAYLCEYKYLYKKVIRSRKIDKLSIISLGCGCCIDYYGAYLAYNRDYSIIKYRGIDLVDWDCVDSLGNPNFKITIDNIKNVTFPKKNRFNIIIFPKSLSEFDQESFDSLLSSLTKTDFVEDCVFLISSAMNKGFEYDSRRYDTVAALLKDSGFGCKDYQPMQEMKEKGGLVRLDCDFEYPNDIIDFLIKLSENCKTFKDSNKNCSPDCKDQLNKRPILTSGYMSFQINCFERTK